eukprot:7736158-Lingulodinium_polyedra.AAC.1
MPQEEISVCGAEIEQHPRPNCTPVHSIACQHPLVGGGQRTCLTNVKEARVERKMPGHTGGDPYRRGVCKTLGQPMGQDGDQPVVHQVEEQSVREQAGHVSHL